MALYLLITNKSIKMKFTPLGSYLNSTQMLSKLLHLVKRQKSYEAVKLPIHLQCASGLTTVALNTFNSQFIVW